MDEDMLVITWTRRQYCDEHSVSACVSARRLSQKPRVQTSRNLLYVYGRGSVLLRQQQNTLCTSGFSGLRRGFT